MIAAAASATPLHAWRLRRIALRHRGDKRRRLSGEAATHRPSRANRRVSAGLRDRRDALEARTARRRCFVATAVERTPVVMPWTRGLGAQVAGAPGWRLEEFEGRLPAVEAQCGRRAEAPQVRSGPHEKNTEPGQHAGCEPRDGR